MVTRPLPIPIDGAQSTLRTESPCVRGQVSPSIPVLRERGRTPGATTAPEASATADPRQPREGQVIRAASTVSTLLSIAVIVPAARAQNANHFYTAEYAGNPKLRVFDVDTGSLVSQVPLQLAWPTDLATAPDGQLYAATGSALHRIDVTTGAPALIGSFGLSLVVGLEFDCSGGALLVTASGQVASVDLATAHAQVLTTFPSFPFSGDIATQGLSICFAAFDRPDGSHLARIDLSATPPTAVDLGVIASGRRVLGLDFDGHGRLIASDDAIPGRFHEISLSTVPITSLLLSDTTAVTITQPIGGLASVVPSGFQEFYCSASGNGCGGSPALAVSGVPSATATSGFVLTATQLPAGRFAALLYTNAGRALIPFGSGNLCLQPPYGRVSFLTGGTSGACDGQVSIDLNSFARGLLPGLPPPQPYLSQPGSSVQCQVVCRDTPSSPVLTAAFEYAICD